MINVAPLMVSSASDDARQHVVDAIGAACQEFGFFQIVGHGMSSALQNQLQQCASGYFSLPRAKKRDIEMAKAGLRCEKNYTKSMSVVL